ncbi:ABC transporter permease [Curtobacterium sp. MCBD17_013]|uniref:ABC transporter permease n=1 Tax=unclassified Curtobacterium TaxID=257496 RepID=UPI000DA7FB96|nr:MULTISPECIES: ABC transporter permease [unclassified Curtobacterium]PZE73465.1 ABC transporter permease [Curtobacterium sp. MCBD17_019]PZF60744.1 ABC transporter permease [Curtobacterium sp. MCBD17_013]WIE53963.1 ABC transporter permease [Curtobacterium sp. MCBD17_003]
MARFLGRRVLVAIPVLFGVVVLVFLILRLIPGDPAQIVLMGTNASPARVAQVRHQMGLDRSWIAQFGIYVGGLLRGDLGYSYVSHGTVAAQIGSRLPSTLVLAGSALAVALVVGIPTGVVGGLWPGSIGDRLATGFSVLGLAVPYFWLAQLLILLFAVRLQWLPALGVGGPQALVLPALSLGLGFAAIITRMLRSALIDVYQQPYVIVARSKGLSSWQLLSRHAFRNAISAVTTIIGLQIGNLLAGAVATEVIFGRPGIGNYLVSQIQLKDIPSIQGIVLFIAVCYIVINILVDVSHGLLDPRVRKAWTA